MTLDLLQNAAVLLALAYVYDALFLNRRMRDTWFTQVLVGLGLGLLIIVAIASSWTIRDDGVILDTRSVGLAIVGLFFGAIPAMVALLCAIAYRIYVGGDGALTGVAVSSTSVLIGLVWRQWRLPGLSSLRLRELYSFGLVVHAVMLLCFVVVPFEDSRNVLGEIWLAVMVVHPLATAMLGLLMVNRLRREETTVEVEESEERYRNIYENRHLVMFLLDPETGHLVDVNPRAEEYYGWPRSVMQGMHISQINILPFEQVRETMRSARDQENNLFHFQHRRAGGDVRDVEVQSGPIRIAGRDLLLSIVQDVTDRRAMESALSEAQAQTQMLLQAIEQNPASVVITDLDARIEYVNAAFTAITGYTRDEVMGRNPKILQSGSTPSSVYEEMWSTLLSGHTWQGEFHNQAKDGRYFWERAVVSPVFDADGEVRRYLAIKQDVTHEREVVEQLRQAQKMEAVGRLAGGVAHDFNNKLQVILGHSDLILGSDVDRDTRRSVEEIRQAAEQSADLTRQLLAFARRQPVQPEVLDVDEAVESSLNLIRRLVGERVRLTWTKGAQGWRSRIDPGQLDQIITNLVVNARDAMPDGGTIDVATATATVEDLSVDELADADRGDYVQITVTDTGTGIASEVLSKLFEPFVTTKPKGAGTGLGLATVYGIVKQNRGLVRVDTGPSGTSFHVFLPRQLEPADEAGAEPDTDVSGSETILVVEDEDAIRILMEQALSMLGYRVLTAGNGEDALAVARSFDGTIDLLVTDLVMPEMNGRELAEALAAERDGLAVLFVSGYTADVIAHHGVVEDDVAFLGKPFTFTELAEEIRGVLDG